VTPQIDWVPPDEQSKKPSSEPVNFPERREFNLRSTVHVIVTLWVTASRDGTRIRANIDLRLLRGYPLWAVKTKVVLPLVDSTQASSYGRIGLPWQAFIRVASKKD
jgi:hypothetical protein